MDRRVSPLERAFQLARSGQVSKLDDLRKTLKQEGYDADALYVGKSLKKQLNDLIKAAAFERPADPQRPALGRASSQRQGVKAIQEATRQPDAPAKFLPALSSRASAPRADSDRRKGQ
jgi:hypothetical protein